MSYRAYMQRRGRRVFKPVVFRGRTGNSRSKRYALVRAARMRRFGRNPALRNLRTGGLLGIETKFLDTSQTATALVSTANCSGGEIQPGAGCTGCLSAPAQGDGAQNREGKKIVIKSVLIKGVIDVNEQAAQASADSIPRIFLALVQDSQTNGVTINSEDVFENVAGSSDACATPFRNMSYTSRFKVLKIWARDLTPPFAMVNNTTAGSVMQNGWQTGFDMSWRGVIPVNFTAGSTTADVANVTDNSLHLIGFCSNATLNPTIRFGCRIRFVG